MHLFRDMKISVVWEDMRKRYFYWIYLKISKIKFLNLYNYEFISGYLNVSNEGGYAKKIFYWIYLNI